MNGEETKIKNKKLKIKMTEKIQRFTLTPALSHQGRGDWFYPPSRERELRNFSLPWREGVRGRGNQFLTFNLSLIFSL
jgi:hypothetical protein